MLLANTEVPIMLLQSASSDAMSLFFARMTDSPKLREPEEPINRTFVLLAQTNKQDFRSTGSLPVRASTFSAVYQC
jgi:hypothetical protein